MMLANKLWYAKIDGKIYSFQSKHQRELAGGEIISEQDVANHANIKHIPFCDFEKWYAARKRKPKQLR